MLGSVPRRSATYEHWFFARAQATLPARPDSMGATKATWQHGRSVGWSNDRRVVMLNGNTCKVAVTQIAAPNSPRLQIAITGARLTSDVKTVTTFSLERLLGIGIDL